MPNGIPPGLMGGMPPPVPPGPDVGAAPPVPPIPMPPPPKKHLKHHKKPGAEGRGKGMRGAGRQPKERGGGFY